MGSTDEGRHSFNAVRTRQLEKGAGIGSRILGVPVPVGQPHSKDLQGEATL